MRKQVKVIGIGHKSGTSKAGNPYDFYVMHATYPDESTEGLCTVSVTVPDEVIPTIQIDNEYLLFTHYYNGRECFDGIFNI